MVLSSRLAIVVNANGIPSRPVAPNIVRITIAEPIAPNKIADPRAARSATVNASRSRVVAIYKLATFLIVMTQARACVSPVSVLPDSVRAIAVNAIGPIAIAMTFAVSFTLGQRRRRNGDGQQQSGHRT